MNLNFFSIITIGIYFLLMLVIGIYSSRKVKTSSDWMVAGKQMGLIVSTGTFLATFVGANTMISYVGAYYNQGWGGMWNHLGACISTFLGAVYFAGRLNRVGKTTLPEFLEERYGKWQALFSSVLTIFATVLLTCVQILGGSAILSAITGLSTATCAIIISIIYGLFTVFGGMVAVAYTDTLSMGVILVGIWIVMFSLVSKAGGLVGMHQNLAINFPEKLDFFANGAMRPAMIVSLAFTWGVGNMGVPHFITRFFICKDEKTARYSQGLTGFLFILLYVPIMLIALSGFLIMPGIQGQDNVSPILMANVAPPLVGSLMMAAIMAACISTADSLLLLASTTFTNDIYKKFIKPDASDRQVMTMSRFVSILIGVFAVLATIFSADVIYWIQAAGVTIMGSAISVSVIFGFTWKRANWQGGLASAIVGFASAMIWYALGVPGGFQPMMIATIAGAITMVLVSLATPPPPQAMIGYFFPSKNTKERTLSHM
jgi:transporter, SSS family